MDIGTFRRVKHFGAITPENPSAALQKALRSQPAHKQGVWVSPDLASLDVRDGTRVQFTWEEGNLGVRASSMTAAVVAAAVPAQSISAASSAGLVNPYNFVSLFGQRPFDRTTAGPTPTHDRFHPGLLSGVLEVTLEAVTPVFVPDGTQPEAQTPRLPWSCQRPGATKPVYGLPGSTVKGVLRTTFEAWTNGHLGAVREPLGALAGPFAGDRHSLRLEDADSSEASFGFAANHEASPAGVISHPFRGRVQPTTLWAPVGTSPGEAVSLGALTSPGNAQHGNRFYVTTQDGARGRKLYWHQNWPGGTLAPADHLRHPRAHGQQFPLPLRPLPSSTRFTGAIHFTNMEPFELGALLVSIAPGYFWETAQVRTSGSRYGIKLGKAKPRGWGSLVCKNLTVTLRDTANAYLSLDGQSLQLEPLKPAEIEATVGALKTWLTARTGVTDVTRLPFVLDLEHLLRLPPAGARWVISYPPQGTTGMPLARDAQVP